MQGVTTAFHQVKHDNREQQLATAVTRLNMQTIHLIKHYII